LGPEEDRTPVIEDPKKSQVHYPSDRRVRLRIRSALLLLFVGLGLLPLAVAWVQYLSAGLPATADLPPAAGEATVAHSFPAWLRLAHYVNFLFLVLLARSGLSILMDHPRLYWNDHCTPGTAWLQLTPLDVPTDRVWTAKDDARYLSPWVGLPGYRHTIGVARHWHLLGALFWFLNGAVFVALLLSTSEWKRLVPTSGAVVAQAWVVFVHYATFHLPPEPDPLVRYNALQQLGYFAVVFVMAPLSVLTGLAMSPAIDNRFRWYPKLFGGRQAARSIHFLLLTGYVGFLVMHVMMVFLTDPVRNMNDIVFGSNDGRPLGLIVGLAAVGLVVVICFLAHWLSWHRPRALQYAVRHVHEVMRWLVFRRWQPRARYPKEAISPFFWPNGKLPATQEWEALAAGKFAGYRLQVTGLVENPVELSLADLAALGRQEQITMHHCIQGWSGIAQWGGLPMARLIELVKPRPDAKVVVFHSFGEGLYGGEYYDTQPMEVALQADTLLAYEMNFGPLPPLYGAPLRLRVESQLGYKMVKWIKAIEFVASERAVGKGHGGRNEDDEYFDLVPEI
jgi:DMSO/TMAO reductase YedYZ molybdopterin-dependent catalytic subunit/thiosulfate reductase cytochrome b subunit